jgi:hypothetical protein
MLNQSVNALKQSVGAASQAMRHVSARAKVCLAKGLTCKKPTLAGPVEVAGAAMPADPVQDELKAICKELDVIINAAKQTKIDIGCSNVVVAK